MFVLDHEIQAWCESVYSGWWHREAKVAELVDHLHCEIERLQTDGLTEEEAFTKATEKMGNLETLIIEHAKNRNFVSIISEYISNLKKWRNSMNPKKAAWWIIVISLMFAATIIFSSYSLQDTQYEKYSQTIMYLLIALWFIPYTFLSMTASGKQGTIKCEYLYFKRKASGIFSRR